MDAAGIEGRCGRGERTSVHRPQRATLCSLGQAAAGRPTSRTSPSVRSTRSGSRGPSQSRRRVSPREEAGPRSSRISPSRGCRRPRFGSRSAPTLRATIVADDGAPVRSRRPHRPAAGPRCVRHRADRHWAIAKRSVDRRPALASASGSNESSVLLIPVYRSTQRRTLRSQRILSRQPAVVNPGRARSRHWRPNRSATSCNYEQRLLVLDQAPCRPSIEMRLAAATISIVTCAHRPARQRRGDAVITHTPIRAPPPPSASPAAAPASIPTPWRRRQRRPCSPTPTPARRSPHRQHRANRVAATTAQPSPDKAADSHCAGSNASNASTASRTSPSPRPLLELMFP